MAVSTSNNASLVEQLFPLISALNMEIMQNYNCNIKTVLALKLHRFRHRRFEKA